MRQKLYDKPNELSSTPDPASIGKPLQDELHGLYRITHGRYRILYRVLWGERDQIIALEIVVIVVFLDIRKEGDKRDVYRLAQKFRRQGKL